MQRYLVRASDSVVTWAAAERLTNFTFPWEPTSPAPTLFRALWSPERLWFRFDCVDEDLVLSEGETAKARVLGSDRVELFFAPELDLDPYFCLEMEPRGAAYAYRARHYRKFDDDFAFEGLQLSASIQERGYTVEGSLPLATLRALGVLKPDAHELKVGVYRAEFSHLADGGVHFGWMPWVDPRTPRPDFHVPSSFGVFELVDAAPSP